MEFGLDRDFGLGLKGEITGLEEVDSYGHVHYDEPIVKKSNDRNVDYIIRDERHVGGPSYEVIVDGHRDHDHHGNFAFVEEEFDYVPEIHYDDVVHYDDGHLAREEEEEKERKLAEKKKLRR